MASNELAAILARRRAKAGGESEPPVPAVGVTAPPTSEPVPAAARNSIAERIARLKQQSAAASAAAPVPVAPRFNHPQPVVETTQAPEQFSASGASVGSASEGSVTSTASEPVDIAAVAAAQDAAGIRRASNKIQQLQGSLGINVNPFGRPGGPTTGGYRKPVGEPRESIMRTGEEQYGHTQHAMGVAMPGMTGSAIPMPGLAKGGFRLPGMAPDGTPNGEVPAAPLDDSHTTMNRVAGPKRRGPARPPAGAFRIPTMAAPIIDNVEPTPAPTAEPMVISAPEPSPALFPAGESAPVAVVKSKEPIVPEMPTGVSPAPVAATLFESPAVAPPVYAAVSAPATFMAPTPVANPPVAVQKVPEPELFPAMKPYELEDLDWSDDDGGPSQPMLFGAQVPKPAGAAAAPTPVIVTPTQPTPELHQAPAPISGSLFGDASSSSATAAASAPAPGFVKAAPQAAIPPTTYGSLFGGAASSSSESDSDSDDEGGLFGTGVPSKR
ncbi:hypothetical protein G195_000824 [Phytophthora kernoviae 00238/432]|uniref:Uncharacterized protein n=1 Tax=Phytophthora kernoviae 00238/432 TaxID=1284355 RepID=A0A8J4WIS0_9STRA|nr:hypothetical protein G195_000824 [Phytophthora kernoviae 00238/432]